MITTSDPAALAGRCTISYLSLFLSLLLQHTLTQNTHMHSLSFSLTHSLTRTLSLSHTHALSLFLTHSLTHTHALSLSHTLTPAHTLSLTHTCTNNDFFERNGHCQVGLGYTLVADAVMDGSFRPHLGLQVVEGLICDCK
jgi:hypothetical protein